MVPFDGGTLKQVTNGESGKAGDGDPSWSPDGASLAFGTALPPASGAAIHVVDLKNESRLSPAKVGGDVVSPLVARRTLHRGPLHVSSQDRAFRFSDAEAVRAFQRVERLSSLVPGR